LVGGFELRRPLEALALEPAQHDAGSKLRHFALTRDAINFDFCAGPDTGGCGDAVP
jgi:hypothetical protein